MITSGRLRILFRAPADLYCAPEMAMAIYCFKFYVYRPVLFDKNGTESDY